MIDNAELDAIAVANDERQGERMIEAVYNFLGRFVAYPSEAAHVAHALWILHTHLMHLWDSTPRIFFGSPEPGSGKTRALEATELLVPSPVTAVNVSPAYLFRKVGAEEGVTILFDEIDTVFGPKAKENEEIRGLLNAGHRRGAVAGRCVVKGKTIETEEISAYAAVAMAGLGWLPDTILSRSVIVPMRRRHQGEQVEQFRRRIHVHDGAKVYAQIEAWAASMPAEMEHWPDLPPDIQDRDADVWEPLVAIADAVGGDWPDRARSAAVALVKESKQDAPSLGVRLLADLHKVFGDALTMSSKEIIAALHAIEESPWLDLKGKALDERGLATRLRAYVVKSKVLWFGPKQARGYDRSDLQDAWSRYLPQQPATSVTAVTSVTPKHSANVTDVTHVTHLPAHGGEGLACTHCGKPGTIADPILVCSLAGKELHAHADCIDLFRQPRLPDEEDTGIPPFLRRTAH